MADAWSLFRSIGRAFGAFPQYLADQNMRYALFRAYGPDWEEKMRQMKAEQEMASLLDRSLLENRRQDLVNKQWTQENLYQQAMGEALENAILMGGRTTGKYTPAAVGRPGTATYTGRGELAWNEAERLRLAKQRWTEKEKRMELQQRRQAARAETQRKAKRDIADIKTERMKYSPEYLRNKEEAEAMFREEPLGTPRKIDPVVARAAVLARARELRPDIEPEDMTDELKLSDYPDEVILQAERDVNAGYTMGRAEEAMDRRGQQETVDLEATPEPEKKALTYRIPVELKLKIDSGQELTPEEIEFLRSLRR